MNGVQTFRQKQKLSPTILDKLVKSREETENLSILLHICFVTKWDMEISTLRKDIIWLFQKQG